MRQPAPNSVLGRLDALVGEWEMEASVGGRPMGRARTAFAWLQEGAFLVQHADAEASDPPPAPEWVANSPLPLTTIIGLDDSSEAFCMLYADACGVFRVYRMSLSEGIWRLWRDAPGFSSASRAPSATTAPPSLATGRARATARPGSTTST